MGKEGSNSVKPTIDITSRKVIEYIKLVIILLLIGVEIIICADAYARV